MNKNNRTFSQKLKFIVGVVILNITTNLEVVVVAIALPIFFEVGLWEWEYWVTIVLVALGGAISHVHVNDLDRKEKRFYEIYGNEM